MLNIAETLYWLAVEVEIFAHNLELSPAETLCLAIYCRTLVVEREQQSVEVWLVGRPVFQFSINLLDERNSATLAHLE